MGEFNRTKIELLQDIQKVVEAIDTEIDWFLIYLYEKDKSKRKIYHSIYREKANKLRNIADEMTKKHGYVK